MLQLFRTLSIICLVFLFQSLPAQMYQEQYKLTPTDRDTFDFFGGHLATDGAFVAVGATATDEDAAGTNFLNNAGGAYIFEYNAGSSSWTEQQKLVASDRSAGDELGYRVALSGSVAVATSFRNQLDENGANAMQDAGAAYVFERQADGSWAELQKLVASDRAPVDRLGRGLAISGDQTILIGAPEEDPEVDGAPAVNAAGAVYVFVKNASNQWDEHQKLVASDRAAGDNFGYSVAADGDFAVVGAFAKDRISGGELYTVAGAAYFFERQANGEWTEVQKVQSPDPAEQAFFGHRVALKGDYAVVAADEESVFQAGGTVIGQAGAVYIYRREDNGTWVFVDRLTAPDPDSKDHFGFSVDIDWPKLLVGAYQDDEDANEENPLDRAGAAFIFEANEQGEWEWSQKLSASDRAMSDFYGRSVAIAGGQLLVGSFRTAQTGGGGASLNGAGGVYVYEAMPIQTLEATKILHSNIFPNPTSSGLRVELSKQYPSVEASLFTVEGKLVYQQVFQNTSLLDLSLPEQAGTYWLHLSTKDSAVIRKVTKF